MRRVTPLPGMRIREDTVFEPGVHEMGSGEGIVIDADDIVVDGNGAVLQSRAPAPSLPEGDFLYTPGDLGLSREIHELLARRIEISQAGALRFEYRCWGAGEDRAVVAVSADRTAWREVSPDAGAPGPEAAPGTGGWRTRRFTVGAVEAGDLSLRFSVPADALSPGSPSFYDGFRLLRGDIPLWEGDARGHWDRWYNTGFSIFKRESRRFFAGTAVRSAGHKGVTLRNIGARGFLTGLHLRDCSGWLIEGTDFTDNYDDPDYGWGEGTESYGAMFLEEVRASVIRRNRALRVWNGMVLRRCSENTIEKNEMSHCSNTCLKMAQSSRNLVQDNVLSWGLRIYPREVHARDSVSLLVESGSNDNRFFRNDFTHGGDGIFIRVLDHWCSTGNLFQDNDCSYANNNAVESWSPGNTYVRNKANWSSYGFWLGGSDATVLRDNEVMHNGTTFRNAPEPFGNAGVSVVHGPSTGFLVTGNRIIDNAGPGISMGYRDNSPARLWLIAGNEIRGNRNDERGYTGHGILVEHAEDIVIGANRTTRNEGRALVIGRGARHVTVDPAVTRVLDGLRLHASAVPTAGQVVDISVLRGRERLSADASLRFTWDFGDGARETGREALVRHAFSEPGRRRISVSAVGRTAAGMATRTLCVLPAGKAIADCADPRAWRLAAEGQSVLERDTGKVGGDEGNGGAGGAAGGIRGGACLRAVVRGGQRSVLSCDLPTELDLSAVRGVSFFYRYSCDLSILSGTRTRTVGLRLHGARGALELVPDMVFKGEPKEDCYDWVYFGAPLEAMRRIDGLDLSAVSRIEILFGPDAPADCIFSVDCVMAW